MHMQILDRCRADGSGMRGVTSGPLMGLTTQGMPPLYRTPNSWAAPSQRKPGSEVQEVARWKLRKQTGELLVQECGRGGVTEAMAVVPVQAVVAVSSCQGVVASVFVTVRHGAASGSRRIVLLLL